MSWNPEKLIKFEKLQMEILPWALAGFRRKSGVCSVGVPPPAKLADHEKREMNRKWLLV
jgi:hypothetical protein